MKVSELGELGLIELIARMVNGSRGNEASWQRLLIGIGDDAAAWQCDSAVQLATTDSLLQDVHFSLNTATWNELGWKALAVNLSDIAAMGGMPRYALVSLALPTFIEVEDVAALYHGMLDLARESGVAIVGGDTDSAPLVIITLTVIGEATDGRMLRRSTALPGDRIAVTGCLGGAAAGLRLVTDKLRFEPQAAHFLRRAFFHPQPRIAEGQLLVREGVTTAIDVSDGLIADLNHICRASRVGARIEAGRLPIAPQVTANFGKRSLELALSGGEDYELLFTAPAALIDRVKKAASCPVTVIGEIVESDIVGTTVLDEKGDPISVPRTGWEHFVT